ncbi:MAG TPA: hypothetical protein VGW33_09065 [Terriglobia bacterium]|nr:hypothetical protein [Terriglobia bacterium]
MKNQALKVLAGLGGLVALAAVMIARPAQSSSKGFTMSASPTTAQTWPLGPTAEYTVGFSSVGGFAGRVNLQCHPSSPEIDCVVEPSSVEVNRELAVSVKVLAGAGAKARGAYSLNVEGRSDGPSNSTAMTLIVR